MIIMLITMMLPLQMRVESCCKGVAHGDAAIRCWRDMRAAGFGEEGEKGDTTHLKECLISRHTGV